MNAAKKITIIDYGMGNLASIKNLIKKIGGEAEITNNIEKINVAEKIILPGVGAFNKAMANLRELQFIEILNKKVLVDKIPLMGICLGMQLLTNYSEEGNCEGLGWIDAKTIKFKFENNTVKVPHMGWTDVNLTMPEHSIFREIKDTPRYYFVHSYYVQCASPKNTIAQSIYQHPFDCGIAKDNIIGFQFHPEKSHKFGMQLMHNFIHYF